MARPWVASTGICAMVNMVAVLTLEIILLLAIDKTVGQQEELCTNYKHPLSVNASMGSRVEFNCSCGSGHAIVWYVNGVLVSQKHDAENGTNYQTTTSDGSFVSRLSMIATEGNNNSRVECGIFEFGHGITRPATPATAILKVQGYLAAPGGLEVIARESSIHLKWTPPFTLDGVRILGYFLAFTDITEIDGSTTNIVHLSYTETEKNLTTVSLLPCHRYQFLVWALNEVGNGTLSDEMNASFQSVPGPVEADTVKTAIQLGSDVGVTFMFQEEDCPGKEADNYTVHVLTAQTQSYLCTHRELRTMLSMDEVMLNFTTTTDVLALNHHYLAVVEAQNHMGGRNSSEIHFSTFDVQNIEFVENPLGQACMQCIFANGSNAKGCHIKLALEEIMAESKAYRNTSLPICFQVAEGGNYTLLVYDIEETTEISTQPAINETIAVTGPSNGMTIHQCHIGLAVGAVLLVLGS